MARFRVKERVKEGQIVGKGSTPPQDAEKSNYSADTPSSLRTKVAELARAAVKHVRDDELFNVPSDARWEREIAQAMRQAYDAGQVEERERCARIADAYRLESYTADHIANAIRNQGSSE